MEIMKTDITLRVDLEIPGQRLIEYLRFYNEDVEKQVEEGVKRAIAELSADNTIADRVCFEIKEKLFKNINEYILGWEVRQAIEKEMAKVVTDKLALYANQVGEQMMKQLNLK